MLDSVLELRTRPRGRIRRARFSKIVYYLRDNKIDSRLSFLGGGVNKKESRTLFCSPRISPGHVISSPSLATSRDVPSSPAPSRPSGKSPCSAWSPILTAPQSGHITCYLHRTYHVLPTGRAPGIDRVKVPCHNPPNCLPAPKVNDCLEVCP
jgi:hypothetical protein